MKIEIDIFNIIKTGWTEDLGLLPEETMLSHSMENHLLNPGPKAHKNNDKISRWVINIIFR